MTDKKNQNTPKEVTKLSEWQRRNQEYQKKKQLEEQEEKEKKAQEEKERQERSKVAQPLPEELKRSLL